MLKRIREKFGTAGLIVAIVALVVAVAGTAYAAAGLNRTQKKEVKKIAKEFAGKPGAPGTPGAKGDAGAQGTPGKDGTNGKDGQSVALVNEAPPLCVEGGYTYEVEGSSVENEVCNGEKGTKGDKGEPWSPNNTLPTGAIETGTWAFSVPAGYGAPVYAPISLPIKLASPIEVSSHIHYQGEAGFGIICPGGAGNPAPLNSAELCVYQTELNEATFEAVYSSGFSANEFGRTGGFLLFNPSSEAAQGAGVFAIKG